MSVSVSSTSSFFLVFNNLFSYAFLYSTISLLKTVFPRVFFNNFSTQECFSTISLLKNVFPIVFLNNLTLDCFSKSVFQTSLLECFSKRVFQQSLLENECFSKSVFQQSLPENECFSKSVFQWSILENECFPRDFFNNLYSRMLFQECFSAISTQVCFFQTVSLLLCGMPATLGGDQWARIGGWVMLVAACSLLLSKQMPAAASAIHHLNFVPYSDSLHAKNLPVMSSMFYNQGWVNPQKSWLHKPALKGRVYMFCSKGCSSLTSDLGSCSLQEGFWVVWWDRKRKWTLKVFPEHNSIPFTWKEIPSFVPIWIGFVPRIDCLSHSLKHYLILLMSILFSIKTFWIAPIMPLPKGW